MVVIIGFGFGGLWMSLLMLAGTSLLSYGIFRLASGRRRPDAKRPDRTQLRTHFYEQRRRARELSEQYDLTDEEIERRIDELCGSPPRDGR